MSDQFFDVLIGILLLSLVGILLVLARKRKTKIAINTDSSGKWVLKAHRLYKSLPILRKYYSKVYGMVQQIYPADTFSVIKRAVTTVTKGFVIFIVGIFFVLIVANGDILYILTGCLVAYVLMSNNISSKINNQEEILLSQFQEFLETLRYHYNETGKVDEAIDMCMENMPSELYLHIQKIYNVITDIDVDTATEKYVQEPNNKYFLMFASICATITIQGDRKLPEGVTVFLNNIKHLQEELNIELLKKKMIKQKFAGVTAFCMIPVFFLKPIELWAKGNQKDMAMYYTGAYGTVVMFLIFFLAIIGNAAIDNLKNGTIDENVKLWTKISNLPFIRPFIIKKININYSKAQRIDESMKRIGSMMSAKQFYVKKYVYAIACMILLNSVIFLSQMNEKNNTINDFDQAFKASYAVNDEYTEQMKEIAKKQVQYHLRDHNLTDEELNQNVINDILLNTEINQPSIAEDISSTVIERVKHYHDIYYQWWYMILTFMIGFLGYKLPDILINFKKKALEMDMEDEIIQFQSIALIMMHIKESTVQGVLEWMEKFAKCFKISITRCLLNIDLGEQAVLEELKDNEPAPQFQKIVNSLMNVDKVGIESAFDSVEVERNFLREKRRMDNEEIISKKARKAWLITFGVLFAIIGLWLIGPMLLMGSSMMSQLSTVMQNTNMTQLSTVMQSTNMTF